MKLGQGYIFTGVCDSVHKGGGGPGRGLVPVGACSRGFPALGDALSGGCLLMRGAWSQGEPGGDPHGMATTAGSMHPTGMHSCFVI